MLLTNLKIVTLAILVLGVYTGIAHIIPQLRSEVPEALALSSDVTPEALAVAGEEFYNGAGGCTACHGLGTRAPNLLTDHAGEGAIGARCGGRPEGEDCKTYLYRSMIEPGAYLVPGFANIMPDQRRTLDETQIWVLIAFLQSNGGEITVTAADLPAEDSGETESGSGAAPSFSATMDPGQLIEELGCKTCHVLDGQGGPLGPPFDGMGGRIDANRIRLGVLDPNAEAAAGYEQFAGTMPPSFGQQLSAAQLEALVQYLVSRR